MMYVYADFGDPIGDYCQALGFSFGMKLGRVAGGPSYRAQRTDVQFSKAPDSLTKDLWLACANGTTISSATIEIWNEKACTMMFTMKNSLITSFVKFRTQQNGECQFGFRRIDILPNTRRHRSNLVERRERDTARRKASPPPPTSTAPFP